MAQQKHQKLYARQYSINFKGFLFYKHFYKVAEKFTSYEPENETNLAFTHLRVLSKVNPNF